MCVLKNKKGPEGPGDNALLEYVLDIIVGYATYKEDLYMKDNYKQDIQKMQKRQ